MKTFLLLALLIASTSAPATAAPAGRSERWIVQLADGTDPESVLAPARLRLGIRPGHVYRNALRGFAATFGGQERAALLRDPRVVAIEPDHAISASFEPQEVQPGVKRVRAPDNPDRADQPLDVDIAVLDTGIQPDHPDLNVDGGYNCTKPGQSEGARQQPSAWADGGFGHGTHVAGIAAARDNDRGVVGVAPGAR
ncbi:MAG TPA: S8 family serine peptidase, partial [Candidatus Caenarcaniphilales bacterium]|nr:S8 family serine peptidase [Candidatus Caenarcaniphilales bacterium]